MKNIHKMLMATLFSTILSINVNAATNYDLLEPATYDAISWSNKINNLNGRDLVSANNADQINPIIVDDVATFEQQEIGEVFYLPIPARELTRELVKITAQKSSDANCSIRIVDGEGNEIQKITQGSVPVDDNVLNNNTKISFGFIYEDQQNVRLEFTIDSAERSVLSFSTMMLSISRITDNPLADHFLNVRARDAGYNVIANNRGAHYSDDSDSDDDSDDEDWGDVPHQPRAPVTYTAPSIRYEHSSPSPVIVQNTPAITIPDEGLDNARNARETFRRAENTNAVVDRRPNYVINRENQAIYTRLETDVKAYSQPISNIHRAIEDIDRNITKKETKINRFENEVQTLGEHVYRLTKDNVHNHSAAFNQNYNRMTANLNTFIAKLEVLKDKIRLDKTVLEDNVANIQVKQVSIAVECAKRNKLEILEQKYIRLCAFIEETFIKADTSVRITDNALEAIDRIKIAVANLKDDLSRMKQHMGFLTYGPVPTYLGPDPAPVVVTPVQPVVVPSVQPVIIEPRLPGDFDEFTYLNLYVDLHNHAVMLPTIDETRAFAKWHYLNHGKNERRKYLKVVPVDFDAFTYLYLNKDLNAYAQTLASDELKIAFAESHYLDAGHLEGRRYLDLPKDFDAVIYLSLYKDLDNHVRRLDSWAQKMAFANGHYLKHGKIEGRRYLEVPNDFDALTYLGLNPDLGRATQNMNPAAKIEWAKNHYANHGKNEGRRYL